MSEPSVERRLDIFRHGSEYVVVARADGHGSIGLLFAGEVATEDREALGEQVLAWLDAARDVAVPDPPLRYPEDLLPGGWEAGDWRRLMDEAALVVVDVLGPERLRLRPYKNLSAIGEDFSHEGGHALDCAPRASAIGSGLRAALDVSRAISTVHRAPALHVGPPALAPEVTTALDRLGARRFERPPHAEVVEVAEGFFVLPAPLRQLLFDIVWRPDTFLAEPDGRLRRITWFPLTQSDSLRAWPLVGLAEADVDERTVLRLDGTSPQNPTVYHLPADAEPAEVLGPPKAPADSGLRLASWLAGLEVPSR